MQPLWRLNINGAPCLAVSSAREFSLLTSGLNWVLNEVDESCVYIERNVGRKISFESSARKCGEILSFCVAAKEC